MGASEANYYISIMIDHYIATKHHWCLYSTDSRKSRYEISGKNLKIIRILITKNRLCKKKRKFVKVIQIADRYFSAIVVECILEEKNIFPPNM